MFKIDNRCILLEGFEWCFIGVICLGMGFYDVVGYFICFCIGIVYFRGKNFNFII